MADTEDELSVLLHRAQAVRDLKKHPGWEILQDYVIHGSARGTAKASKKVLNGFVRDLDEYNKTTGFLQGVDFVLNADEELEELAANMRARLDAA